MLVIQLASSFLLALPHASPASAPQAPVRVQVTPSGAARTATVKFRDPVAPAIAASPTGSASSSLVAGGSDSCGTATPISGPGPFLGDNIGATLDGPVQCSIGGTTLPWAADVWYLWTSSGTGTATASLCGTTGFCTALQVFATSGCVGSSLDCDSVSCGSGSQVTFSAVAGSSYKIRIGGYAMCGTTAGPYTMNITEPPPPPPPPANDSCTSPEAIAGLGTFAFSNGNALTGTQGQAEAICLFSGTTAITNDVWYTWTSPADAVAMLELCSGGAIDSKVAVYVGAGCPAGPAIACNDDACGFRSAVSWTVQAGQTYTIQLGNYPGTSTGSGTFTITLPEPCGPQDDGSSELLFVVTGNPRTVLSLQRYGQAGDFQVVTTVSAVFGSPIHPGAYYPNGTPIQVGVWDDPDDDGNPLDAVLLRLVDSTVQNVETEIFNPTPIEPPVGVSGIYFVGVGLPNPNPTGGSLGMIGDSNTPDLGRTWRTWSAAGVPYDYTNLANNLTRPYPAEGWVWMLRTECADSWIEDMCFGDAGCPCSNPGAAGHGCANSTHPGGARLSGLGAASLADDTLVLDVVDQHPGFLSIVLQGNVEIPPVVFGDGLRCIGGNLKRLFLVQGAQSSSISAPSAISNPPSPATVSSQSAAKGDPLSVGFLRAYQVYFRDANPNFCPTPPGNTFNITNGVRVIWTP